MPSRQRRLVRFSDEAAHKAPGKAGDVVQHVNTAGTNTSDSIVDMMRPITAIAIGERKPPPSPRPKADGNMPAAIAMVVITIGLARLRCGQRRSRLPYP
jgi:hypothetical protein